MDIPYTTVFVGLLVAYLAYSVWARLDGRYPIGAALALLVITAVVDAAGDTNAANALAEFVFFLLAGGVVLLLIEHVRERPGPAVPTASASAVSEAVAAEATEERKGPTEQSLHGPEEQPVSLVDRSSEEDDDHEQKGNSDPEHGKPPEGNVGVQEPEHEPDRNAGDKDRDDVVPAERVDPRQ